MTETMEQRIQRLESAAKKIVQHPISSSFIDLVQPNRSLFRDFRLLYSTEIINSEIGGISLASIEKMCPAITRFFCGSGLLFYDDEIHDEILRNGAIVFPLDYSISFDTQVAEAFRCYEEGKNISDWELFHELIFFIKNGSFKFNFDYTFYILEDLVHTYDLNNMRPFKTIRALKRFDHLDVYSFLRCPKKPVFNEDIITAGKKAADAIYSFQSSKEIKRILLRRKALKLLLMQGMKLRWQEKDDYLGNLGKLIEFSIQHLGRFSKMEIYFAWKLIKYGEKYRFFGPLMQKTETALEKINGMSWDLYSLRHHESMSSSSKYGRFHIPFIATFDRRFKELIRACPIRCLLIDDRTHRLNTIFFDEYEFFQDVTQALSSDTHSILSDPKEKIKRFNDNSFEAKLDFQMRELQKECEQLVLQK